MTDAQPPNQPPPLAAAAQTIITECDAKLERYRAALDAGADPAVVTEWISQTQAERARAEADLHTHSSNRPRRMSRTEIKDLVLQPGLLTLAELWLGAVWERGQPPSIMDGCV
ncbi:hypothetical protein ABZU69_36065, partial [Micromonospora sp. NPDC005206]